MIRFSVVINTHNRADLLEDALRGVVAQNYPAIELIVVNGPSTDGTAELLNGWRDRIKILSCPQPNLSVSRNLGIAAAAGDVVAFIDDDGVPHPQWLRELSYAYADPRVGAVGGFTLDASGVVFQARKQAADRFGNAVDRPDEFDERVLNKPGSALYPALLGTNSSFRRAALLAVDGFDPVYAYYLDETDLCLRLVDAGWRVMFAPDALVFHQFAPSAERDRRRAPLSILRLVTSKSYFIWRHGTAHDLEQAGRELAAFEARMRADNASLLEAHAIDLAWRVRLDDELQEGLRAGRATAFAGLQPARLGDSEAVWRELPSGEKPVLAVVTRTVMPWIEEFLAQAVEQGWVVHVIAEAAEASAGFHQGIWWHLVPVRAGSGEVLSVTQTMPAGDADWCATAGQVFASLRDFGVRRIASSLRGTPGWGLKIDLLLDDGGTAELASSHPDWRERVLFQHFHVDKLIAVEARFAAAITRQLKPGDDAAALLQELKP